MPNSPCSLLSELKGKDQKWKTGNKGHCSHYFFAQWKFGTLAWNGAWTLERSRSGHRTQHPNSGLSRKIRDGWQPYSDGMIILIMSHLKLTPPLDSYANCRNIVGNPQIKERAYKTLVHPILEYSSTVWDPYTSTAMKKVESVQHRAAHVTLNHYRKTCSVGAMLTELNWQLLAERRRIAHLVMFYNICCHLVAITMPLESKTFLFPSKTENSLAYVIPASYCDYRLHSFFPRTVREWNFLPQPVVVLLRLSGLHCHLPNVDPGTPLHCCAMSGSCVPSRRSQEFTEQWAHCTPNLSARAFNLLKFALKLEEEEEPSLTVDHPGLLLANPIPIPNS